MDSASSVERVTVAIVGAGPAGLSAGWKLRRAGISDFAILDLESHPGGTSCSSSAGTVPHPWGAHYVPLPLPHQRDMIELLAEMGVLTSVDPPRAKETALVRAPETRLFVDGRWTEGLFPVAQADAGDLKQWERFSEVVGRYADFRDEQGRRAFTIPVADCSDAAELRQLDELSADDWLTRQGLTSPRLRWYVQYACRDDYGTDLRQTSAWAMLFYFSARLPSSKQTSAPFLTWPEGNGRIVQHLSRACGDSLRLNQLVTRVAPSEQGFARGAMLTVVDARSGAVRLVKARHVIVCVPQFIARRIVVKSTGPALQDSDSPGNDPRSSPPDRSDSSQGGFSYSAWLVANLHLSGRPKQRGVDLAWDSVIYDSPSLGYVDARHQTLVDRGATVWTYYHPLTDFEPSEAREWLLRARREDLVEGVVSDLRTAHPDLLEYVERVDIWRWGHAMVRPSPGTIWGAARARAAEPMGCVRFAHSDLSGLALFEEAQYWGVRAARSVILELNSG